MLHLRRSSPVIRVDRVVPDVALHRLASREASMTRPPGWLERLVDDGTYARLVAECQSDAEIAARLDTTPTALRKARKRLNLTGHHVPTVQQARLPEAWQALGERYPGGESTEPTPEAVGEFEWEEKTEPNIRVVSVEETITRVEEHRLKKRVRDLEAERNDLARQLSDGGEYHEVVAEVLARQNEAPPIRIEPRERTSGLREGTPLVLASDWHIEEEVRPEQVAGRNRYNLEISAQRMERFFEATLTVVRHQRAAYKVRDLIGWWGGDFITNFLHDDNVESNLLHPTEALLYAEHSIIRGIDHWLTDPEIEQFTFPCNDGNHGRLTEKTRAATRIENSLEVFLYAHLAHHYRNEPRVRFILPTSAFTFLDDVYGHTIRFTHGDTFKYGGGVGGLLIPLHRAIARWESVKRADLTCVAHWHQRIGLPHVMVNGSLIGYSAYAMSGGFPFEPPVQSLRMLDSRRWTGADVPLFVSDRADDVECAA